MSLLMECRSAFFCTPSFLENTFFRWISFCWNIKRVCVCVLFVRCYSRLFLVNYRPPDDKLNIEFLWDAANGNSSLCTQIIDIFNRIFRGMPVNSFQLFWVASTVEIDTFFWFILLLFVKYALDVVHVLSVRVRSFTWYHAIQKKKKKKNSRLTSI